MGAQHDATIQRWQRGEPGRIEVIFSSRQVNFKAGMPSNPFPGMNPYLQDHWSDVHTALIGFIREALADTLPPDLSARAEERITVLAGEDESYSYRTAIAVIEPWRAGFPPIGGAGDASLGTAAPAVAEPLLFHAEAITERWIEVHDAGGELVTVLEVLSPGNKTESGPRAYLERQQHFLAAGVNLVEIDLVRGGTHLVCIERERLRLPAGTCYLVCVARILGDGSSRREVYLCPLREPLPTIRVPLRRGDPDNALPLQALVDRCYRTGRYWLSDRNRAVQPPAADEAENAWMEERLRAAGRSGGE